jgi:hypothetical protein
MDDALSRSDAMMRWGSKEARTNVRAVWVGTHIYQTSKQLNLTWSGMTTNVSTAALNEAEKASNKKITYDKT